MKEYEIFKHKVKIMTFRKSWISSLGFVLLVFVGVGPVVQTVKAVRLPDFDHLDPCDEQMVDLEMLGPIRSYLNQGYFSDYKFQIWMYYFYNVTSMPFLWLNTITFANRETIGQICPEAMLMSLLLRAEERLPFFEAGLPLIDINLALVDLMNQGQVGARTINFLETDWPIQVGMERIQVKLKKDSTSEVIASTKAVTANKEKLKHEFENKLDPADPAQRAGVRDGSILRMTSSFGTIQGFTPSVGMVIPYCGEDLSSFVFRTMHTLPLKHVTLYLYLPARTKDSESTGSKGMNDAFDGSGVLAGNKISTSKTDSKPNQGDMMIYGDSYKTPIRYSQAHTESIANKVECGDKPLKPASQILKRHFKDVLIFRTETLQSEWEVKRYFHHVIANYDRLDDFTVFGHPDLLEHVAPRTLRNVLSSLMLGSYPVTNLESVSVGEPSRFVIRDNSMDMMPFEEKFCNQKLKAIAARNETESSYFEDAIDIFEDRKGFPKVYDENGWTGYSTLSHHYILNFKRINEGKTDCDPDSTAKKDWSKLMKNLGFVEPLISKTIQKLNIGLKRKYESDIESPFKGKWAAVKPDGAKTSNQPDGATEVPRSFYCCSQFMVRKDKLLQYSKERYQKWHDIRWNHCLTSYMEVIWPLLFGTPRDFLKRQDRSELPLYLRVDNFVETDTQGVT